ncbi:porin [Halioglobus maricola]|uniref:Porin n=1 Tax=Halioglobus maricola TaxID=2601894 RepID=A0A5P9NRH0_9GAMM|nr:carbohydrate porin [Halioglobus maricola]QFU77598.1 porin [Halioglobus maricola]
MPIRLLCAVFAGLSGLFGVSAAADEIQQEDLEELACTQLELEQCSPETLREWVRWFSIAGPDQVERRIGIDALPGDPLFKSSTVDAWQARKKEIETSVGVSWSTDYISAYLYATESPGDDSGAGGALRFYGVWQAYDGEGADSGALVWKVEHRHAYGSSVSPQGLASEVGYAGLLHLTLSDQQLRLTNLYWRQRMFDGNLVVLGGWLDTSDYVDVYTLASPWTDFFNYAFSTGSASMPVPNEGLGVAVGGYLTDQLYVIGGFADTNSDPHDPSETFDTFFSDREYFKHLDIGWNSSRETAFLNNVHISLWQTDEREEAGVEEGWGANFSWSRLFNRHWTVFLRGGYADDGGSILEESVSTGFAWRKVPGGNLLGVGLNWGVPMESTYGPDLPEQTTLETYYRIQLFEELAITPDVQYIRNPAVNPAESSIWVLGLRLRLAF